MTHVARWHEFAYEQTDIPAGMTVGDWRTQRARTRPTSRRWSQIIGALRGGHGGDAAWSRASDAPPEPCTASGDQAAAQRYGCLPASRSACGPAWRRRS